MFEKWRCGQTSKKIFLFYKALFGFSKKTKQNKKKPTPLYYFFAILMFFIFIFKKERENTKNKVAKKIKGLSFNHLSLSLYPSPNAHLRLLQFFRICCCCCCLDFNIQKLDSIKTLFFLFFRINK
jgi:hypothetical protein